MKVRARKSAARKGAVQPQRPATTHVFPAPVRGLVLNENEVMAAPGGAKILDNWVCTVTGVRVRGGASKYATISASGGVTALMSYKDGASEKFFGATADSIFDISSVADPDIVPTAAVSGQSSGAYGWTQFGTTSGTYLYALNGVDDLQLFDGSSWAAINSGTSPAITGVNTSALSFPWSYASRMFFVESGTLNAWFLPVDSIGGAANSISLAGVFRQGGALLFGATWSLDAGDGLDDKCVFVSTEGEVAIFEGTDPSSSSAWSKVGVYQISKPMGKNAAVQAGGDLLIATELGVVPLSQAISKDKAALTLEAVTRPIEPYWRTLVNEQTTQEWEMLKWAENSTLIVSLPDIGPSEGACLVANLHTGAWSRFTGWDTQCLGQYGVTGYFGTSDGLVMSMETGGSDNGAVYTCSYLGLHEQLSAPGQQKTVGQIRATFSAATPINPKVSVTVDYQDTLASAPSSPADFDADVWDTGVWDEAIWDAASATSVTAEWVSVGRTGYAIAPEIQLTFGVSPAPAAELVSIEMTYSIGALVA